MLCFSRFQLVRQKNFGMFEAAERIFRQTFSWFIGVILCLARANACSLIAYTIMVLAASNLSKESLFFHGDFIYLWNALSHWCGIFSLAVLWERKELFSRKKFFFFDHYKWLCYPESGRAAPTWKLAGKSEKKKYENRVWEYWVSVQLRWYLCFTFFLVDEWFFLAHHRSFSAS